MRNQAFGREKGTSLTEAIISAGKQCRGQQGGVLANHRGYRIGFLYWVSRILLVQVHGEILSRSQGTERLMVRSEEASNEILAQGPAAAV